MKVMEDLTVVELASVLAGPAVGRFFSELGARVIKIENKTVGGDVTRHWKLPSEDPDAPTSAYFHSVNYRKEHRFLDLNDAADLGETHRLIAGADVVISNFRPAAARRWKLDHDSLLQDHPRLIYAQLDAFGPDDERPAFDIILQAETGYLSMCGTAAGEAARLPVALIDLLAAHQLKEGILLALLRREREGRGGLVRTSLYAAALSSLANQATNYLIGGHVPGRMGTLHPNIAPYGDLFTTADGKPIVFAIGNDRQFSALTELLDLPPDNRFTANGGRVSNRPALVNYLSPAVRHWECDPLLAACEKLRIPAGRLRDLAEVFEWEEARAL
ncbi:MAG: CoA transferase, partial [Saprospiraceae bacterium]